ncbi:uncharacterized protein V1518DRAFT_412085 [Limtongia smithiae]|uniref:uncharacterized protein n=1 Tax=Limtongia smithiae TaxID=1125753 RepID=UPI0034CE2698
MGVHGLWSIIGPVARPVKLEHLHGKKLAVDASIWIYHFLKAVRDKDGNALPNAHIVGFFRRICKLLFHGILPVFVFDGDAPAIKKQTIAGRKQRRQGRENDATNTASKLVSLQMQRLAEQEVRGERSTAADDGNEEDAVYFNERLMTTEERAERQKKRNTLKAPTRFKKLDPYHLPEQEIAYTGEDPRMMTADELERYAEEFKTAEDIGLYDTSNIDFTSPEFNALPMTVQYQLLNTARLRSRLRMGYSKEQLDQFFPDRLEFSKFQIARVKERNFFSQKMFNLNGMAEDLSMRIAGEKDREYILKKNANGWTLALEADSAMASQPINVDEHDNDSVNNDEDDEWEDVPLRPQPTLYALPRPDQLTRGSFILPGIHEDDDSNHGKAPQTSSALSLDSDLLELPQYAQGDGDKLFTSDDEQDEDDDLQVAIALSLEQQEELTSPRPPVTDSTIPPSVIEPIQIVSEHISEVDDNDASAALSGPFLWDDGDDTVSNMIQNLPRLPTTSESTAEGSSNDALERGPQFIPSRFNMRKSIFGRKHARTDDKETLATGTSEISPQSPKKMKVDDKVEVSVTGARESSEVVGLCKTTSPLAIFYHSDDEKSPVDPATESTDRLPLLISELSDEEDVMSHNVQPVESVLTQRSPSSEWEEVEIASSAPVVDVLKPLEQIVRQRSPSSESDIVDISASGPEESEELSNDSADDEPGQVDVEEEYDGDRDLEAEEETELVEQIAEEEEEHERFTREINRSATQHTSRQESSVNYDVEIQNLKNQQRLDRRDADTVTNVMVQECQELLARFGIPYVTAPMEAEAQCAELLSLQLVDGVITDDSDIFLFGASKVYKNMFNQAKFVECYLSKDIQLELDLDQSRMIELAHLLGSDYAPGIQGVGPVTAMQLLKDFKSENTLADFRAWWDAVQHGDNTVDSSSPFRKRFRKKSKTLFFTQSLPDPVVVDAYLHPTVDEDRTQFVWGTPDLDGIRRFLMSSIGWSKQRADEVLVPLIKTMNLKKQSIQFNKSMNKSGGVGVRSL